MTDDNRSAFSRLRRLQEHTLSNIPALIANRAMSSFTLHHEPQPEESTADVRVVVYPQDPFVSEPEVRLMSASDIRPELINARFRLRDSESQPAQPDEEGNYLYWPGTPEFDQVNAFYYATFTLRMYERYARRELPWSFPAPRVDIDPHAGSGVNAFYSESDRLLGFFGVEHNGTPFRAAQSADIVSHETAHAVLDGVRDLYNESFGLGAQGFHESFGDMTAVLVALHDDSLVQRLLSWTQGNLRLNNFIASIADHIGFAAKQSEAFETHVHEHTMYLRNCINDFKSAPFDQLPYRATNYDLELARESHNYSRLFTGAFYDVLVGVFEHLKTSMPERIALHRSRDMVGTMLMCAIECAPVGELDFSDMARAFLAAARVHHADTLDILKQVFDARGILSRADADAHIAYLEALPDLRLPEAINSALAAARFLETEVIPALKLPAESDLTPLAAYRNASGTAYLTFFSHRRITLKGKQYKQFDGSHVDAFGGLTLMFGADDRLQSVCYRPVTDSDVYQIGVQTRELIEHGLIATHINGSGLTPQSRMLTEKPKGLWIPELPPDAPLDLPVDAPPTPPKPSKLVKFPVIFDAIPRPLSGFKGYLESWRMRWQKR